MAEEGRRREGEGGGRKKEEQSDEDGHTYVLEDAYLSALADGLMKRKLDDLPNTPQRH